MTYAKFEKLVLFFSFTVVVGTIIASYYQQFGLREIIGQFLILVVIFGALRYGIKGGFWTALTSSIIYALINVDSLITSFFDAIIFLISLKVSVYFLIGLIVGLISTQIKYFFAKLKDSNYVDEKTNLYSKRYIYQLIEKYQHKYTRYQNPFTLGFFQLKKSVPMLNKNTNKKSKLKHLGSLIRNDVRIVDEVGYLGKGKFCVIFPNTNLEGGKIAAKRIWNLILNNLSIDEDEFNEKSEYQILGYPEDSEEIQKLKL